MDDETKPQHAEYVDKTEDKPPVQENVEAEDIESAPTVDTLLAELQEGGQEAAETGSLFESQQDDGKTKKEATEEKSIDSTIVDDDASAHEEPREFEEDASLLEGDKAEQSVIEDEDNSTLQATVESETEDGGIARSNSSRRTSKRTEQLIQAAARDIVAQIELQKQTNPEENGDESVLGNSTDASHDHEQEHDPSEVSFTETSELEHDDTASHISEATPIADEGGDSSSQHEDVFSNRTKSNRSSLGSYDGGSESGKALDHTDNNTIATRTPRLSEVSQYNKEEFIRTARGTPRPAFRTPSEVRAMQMSSPTASVYGSGVISPRSSKRAYPSVSRLGSPSASAQYSPKNRTPSRFKVTKEAPLVLLHATLLPLRWMWGDLVNTLDTPEMSDDAKTLRESWRILQDRMGDTLLERGILLGHPQNDYEVLEERLLEALELPMRRRARILECGHYVGPANESTLGEDDGESEDEYDMIRPDVKRHWCNTCKHEIRFDSLGPAKIFRVKVYASNGLMKAGAWAACWKEMERVDVELEPVVEPAVQEELVRLAAVQEERAAAQQQQQQHIDVVSETTQQLEDQQNLLFSKQPDLMHTEVEVPPARPESSATHRSVSSQRLRSSAGQGQHRRSPDEQRRIRDEARMREIYGLSPEPDHAYSESAAQSPTHSYQAQSETCDSSPSPPPPSDQPHRSMQPPPQPYHSASLSELLLQSVRVLMQDRKNVVIVTLSVFVLLMALRSPPQLRQQQQRYDTMYEFKNAPQMHRVPAAEQLQPAMQHQQAVPIMESVVAYIETTQSVQSMVPQHTQTQLQIEESVLAPSPSTASSHDPCQTLNAARESAAAVVQSEASQETATVTEKKIVKVVETITETETMKVRVTATATEEVPEPSVHAAQASKPSLEAAQESESAVEPAPESETLVEPAQESETLVEPAQEPEPSVAMEVPEKAEMEA